MGLRFWTFGRNKALLGDCLLAVARHPFRYVAIKVTIFPTSLATFLSLPIFPKRFCSRWGCVSISVACRPSAGLSLVRQKGLNLKQGCFLRLLGPYLRWQFKAAALKFKAATLNFKDALKKFKAATWGVQP